MARRRLRRRAEPPRPRRRATESDGPTLLELERFSHASLARHLGLWRPPGLVRSVAALQRQLLHRNWRMLPMQFDLPANTQVFGRIAVAAGIHGILYRSTRHAGARCLALYPQNWRDSGSFVEVADPVPEEARVVRLDATTGSVE